MAQDIKYPVWFGEWSLGTDTCLLWIGGFNDGFVQPPLTCKWQDCPQSYLPEPFNFDFDRQASLLGPFGTGWPEVTNIHNGQCVHDSSTFTDEQVKQLAQCVLQSHTSYLAGSFFEAATTMQENAKWSFLQAAAKGLFSAAEAVVEIVQ